jgi:hypothetical protein
LNRFKTALRGFVRRRWHTALLAGILGLALVVALEGWLSPAPSPRQAGTTAQGVQLEGRGPRGDLTQALGKPIADGEAAARAADEFLAGEREAGGCQALELLRIEHDPEKNLWIFMYWERTPGSERGVAVDGESGDVVRMWGSGE